MNYFKRSFYAKFSGKKGFRQEKKRIDMLNSAERMSAEKEEIRRDYQRTRGVNTTLLK